MTSEPRGPELAYRFEMGKCVDPHCTAAHINLIDANDKHFATMTVALEHIPNVIAWLQGHAYAMTAGGENP